MIPNVAIRRLKTDDAKMVAVIDKIAYSERYWSEKKWRLKIEDNSNYFGYVATIQNIVCGYVIYGYWKSNLVIIKLAVEPLLRRQGIGSLLLKEVQNKFTRFNIPKILIVVRDNKLDSHLFLKSQTYKAVEVRRNFFSDLDGAKDGYIFEFS